MLGGYRKHKSLLVHQVLLVFFVFLFSACEEETKIIEAGESTVIAEAPAPSVTESDGSKTVCDPFANNPDHPAASLDHGIVGKLFYLQKEKPRYKKVIDYQTLGTEVDATLFFNQINVPTRKFNEGFINQRGEPLRTPDGDLLYEYFSLRMESLLKLSPQDDPADYQFGLLADDGAILSVDTGSGYEVIVDDDGDHPTKFACATKPVTFATDSKIPIKLNYYQGPRHHIAVILLWRKWPAAGPDDPACGKQGNGLFFNWNVSPSVPAQTHLNLLARGWKVPEPVNFALPGSIARNPCNGSGGGEVEDPVEPPPPPPPPTTEITVAEPSALFTNQTAMTISFVSNYADATFQCSLDSAAFSDCASPVSYSGLANGAHSFFVQASRDGITDSTGASHTWTVDTVAPQLASSVTAVATNSTITVNWTTNEPTTTTLSWGLGTLTNNVVASDGIYSTSHTVTLSGLTPNTIYSYIVGGADQAGNLLLSGRRSLRTNP